MNTRGAINFLNFKMENNLKKLIESVAEYENANNLDKFDYQVIQNIGEKIKNTALVLEKISVLKNNPVIVEIMDNERITLKKD